MTITRIHICITVLIALALHAGIAMWFELPTPAPRPLSPALPLPLRVNLLAVIADHTVNAAFAAPEPPPEPASEPIVEPEPTPAPQPPPPPKPVVQEAPVEPQPLVKQIPEPQPPTPRPANNVPEIEQPPKPTQEVVLQSAPAAPSVAPPDAVATARYEQLLVAWLEKHKKYPRRAKRLRIEGQGMLRILIDRTGRTQRVTLEQRTGNRLLDKAALYMVQLADPFPPMPENDPRRELEFIIPVVFALR